MEYRLTKSKYIRGLQCHKALYLDVFRPELGKISWETRQKFAQGRSFEATYKAQFPNGIDLSHELGYKIDLYPTRTAELLAQNGDVVLFEAGFCYNEVLVLADVVHKTPEGRLIIHEVKNSTRVSETFARDVAVQHYVISHCVDHIDEFAVVHHDGNGGFVVADQLDQARRCIDEIARNIEMMKQILAGTEPQIQPGDHCDAPYECPYKEYCRGSITAQLELPF